MKQIDPEKAIIIVCEDQDDTYTWVATDLEAARKFVRENLEEIYQIGGADTSDMYATGSWVEFGDVKYLLDRTAVV